MLIQYDIFYLNKNIKEEYAKAADGTNWIWRYSEDKFSIHFIL